LLELSRQRLRPSLEETAHINCPRCSGTGFIRGTESTALHLLRILQEEAMKENTGAVHAQVPVDVASFLLNEKRSEIQKLEARLKVNIVLVPNSHIDTPHYRVQRLRHDELNQMEHVPASYELVEAPEETGAEPVGGADAKRERQEAAVKGVTPDQPAPMVAEVAPAERAVQRAKPATHRARGTATETRSGIISRILGWFKLDSAPATAGSAPRSTDSTARARGEDARRRPHTEGRARRPEQRSAPGRGGRGGRGERGGRGGGRGEHSERGERGEGRRGRGEERSESGARAEPRASGQPRRERGERGARGGERKQESGAPQAIAAMAADARAPSGPTTPSREGDEPRRRRGRRDRQRDRERSPDERATTGAPADARTVDTEAESATVTAQTPFEQAAPERVADAAEPMVVALTSVDSGTSNDLAAATYIEASAETEMSPEPVIARTIEPIAEVVLESAAATTTAPAAPPSVVQAETQPPAAVATQVFEPVEPQAPPPPPQSTTTATTVAADATTSLSDTGLVLIETDRAKAATQPEPEPVKLGRPRQERAQPVEEELVQIETDK